MPCFEQEVPDFPVPCKHEHTFTAGAHYSQDGVKAHTTLCLTLVSTLIPALTLTLSTQGVTLMLAIEPVPGNG